MHVICISIFEFFFNVKLYLCVSGKIYDKFNITWSKGEDLHSIVFLADHLNNIMRAEKKIDISSGPPTHLSKR